MFSLIVGARMKARTGQALAIGWHAEAFARTKRMSSLDDYLQPALSAERRRQQGADNVRRMFERMIRQQAAAEASKQGGG